MKTSLSTAAIIIATTLALCAFVIFTNEAPRPETRTARYPGSDIDEDVQDSQDAALKGQQRAIQTRIYHARFVPKYARASSSSSSPASAALVLSSHTQPADQTQTPAESPSSSTASPTGAASSPCATVNQCHPSSTPPPPPPPADPSPKPMPYPPYRKAGHALCALTDMTLARNLSYENVNLNTAHDSLFNITDEFYAKLSSASLFASTTVAWADEESSNSSLPLCPPFALHPASLPLELQLNPFHPSLARMSTSQRGHFVVQCRGACGTTSTCDWSTLRWRIPGCRLFPFLQAPPSIRQCLRAKTLAFIGDSTLRGIYNRILDAVGLPITPAKHKGDFGVLEVGDDGRNSAAAFFGYWPNFWLYGGANHTHNNLLFTQTLEKLASYSLNMTSDSGKPVSVLERPTTFVLFGVTISATKIDTLLPILRSVLGRFSLAPQFAGSALSTALSGTNPATQVSRHFSIVAKSKGAAYSQDFMQQSVAEMPELYQLVRASGLEWFETLTLSLPFWHTFKHDKCVCHPFQEINENPPGSRVIGLINDVWTTMLLNGICHEFRA